nr:proline-rich receptor-like protein kinase PERK10 [Aegilops tauschii subsp. strangulata]
MQTCTRDQCDIPQSMRGTAARRHPRAAPSRRSPLPPDSPAASPAARRLLACSRLACRARLPASPPAATSPVVPASPPAAASPAAPASPPAARRRCRASSPAAPPHRHPTDAPPTRGYINRRPSHVSPVPPAPHESTAPRRPTHPPFPRPPPEMAFYRGSSSSVGADDGIPGSWPTSLGEPETEELHRYCFLVPPGCRIPRNWKIDADGYSTPGPGTSEEELRSHSGGRHNAIGRRNFWRGKDYWEVIAAFRLAAAGVTPDLMGGSGRLRAPPPPPDRRRRAGRHGAHPPAAPAPTAPPSSPELELSPEQVILREDGDPNDTPGYHVALRASEAAAAREAAEVAAAIEAAEAMAAEQAAMALEEWQQPPAEWQQEWQQPPGV